jgi:hypothetical protein
MPTFVTIPMSFENGTIEVDILDCLNGKGPADARAFAGIAYRITEDAGRFESVYVRRFNGLKANPPRPRDRRAVQYFACPTGGMSGYGNTTRTAATKPALISAPMSGSI